jgi:ribosomal protein S6
MAEKTATTNETGAEDAGVIRVYEVGYHIVPTTKEEDLDKIVGSVRSIIEKSNGSFIAEGAPVLTRLSYPISIQEGEKHVEYDRGYFGWIKFEANVVVAHMLDESLKKNSNLLRHIIFQTVREDTRAKYRAPQLREVKRTDTIKAAPRRVEESAAPVSEEQLEKALEDITAE